MAVDVSITYVNGLKNYLDKEPRWKATLFLLSAIERYKILMDYFSEPPSKKIYAKVLEYLWGYCKTDICNCEELEFLITSTEESEAEEPSGAYPFFYSVCFGRLLYHAVCIVTGDNISMNIDSFYYDLDDLCGDIDVYNEIEEDNNLDIDLNSEGINTFIFEINCQNKVLEILSWDDRGKIISEIMNNNPNYQKILQTRVESMKEPLGL